MSVWTHNTQQQQQQQNQPFMTIFPEILSPFLCRFCSLFLFPPVATQHRRLFSFFYRRFFCTQGPLAPSYDRIAPRVASFTCNKRFNGEATLTFFFPDLYSESSEIRIKCRTTFHGITTFHIVLSSMSVTHTVQSGHRLSDSHSVIHYNVRTGMKKHRCMHSGCMNGGCDQI